MKITGCWCVVALCVAITSVEGKVTLEGNTCPVWTTYNSTRNQCVCGSSLSGIVDCHVSNCTETSSIRLKRCYCMSYYNSGDNGSEVVGNCPLSCSGVIYYHHEKDSLYRTVKITETGDDEICTSYKRRGPMCGLCERNHTPPVYSYSFTCVECTNYKLNWLKYIAIAYLPLTVFCFLVLVLKLSATSGSINALVTIIQLAAAPGIVRIYLLKNHFHLEVYFQLATGICSILNLDFLKPFYHPFCLHPSMTTIQVFSLDYLLGVYPLFLIIVIFVFVKLHDQCNVVVFCWRPCHTLYTRFSNKLNIKNSLIQAFSTFILLSYVKILNVTFDILTPGKHYLKPDGSEVDTQYWYYNGSLEYFGKDHIPYAVLAILMSLIFNVLPLALLILYPFSCFQKLLQCLKLQSNVLNIFMDTFNGCYRAESKYYSLFAAVYVLLRVINLLLFSVLQGLPYFSCAGYVVTLALVLVAVFRPYLRMWHNLADVMLLLCILTYNQYVYTIMYFYISFYVLKCIGLSLIILIPPTYGVSIMTWHLTPRCCINRLKLLLNRCFHRNLEESLPHRLQQSNECSPLIH